MVYRRQIYIKLLFNQQSAVEVLFLCDYLKVVVRIMVGN